jgi:hypothetical protein
MPKPGHAWPAPPVHRRLVTVEPLRTELLDLDTAAYVASPEAIRAHSAGSWPTDGFTTDTNRELVARHEAEHDAGEAFAYAILANDRVREYGCAYLRRLADFCQRTGTVVDGLPAESAITTFWAIDDAASRPSHLDLLGEIAAWVDAWGVAPWVLRALPAETEVIAAAVELGMTELNADHQQLPYRWLQPG